MEKNKQIFKDQDIKFISLLTENNLKFISHADRENDKWKKSCESDWCLIRSTLSNGFKTNYLPLTQKEAEIVGNREFRGTQRSLDLLSDEYSTFFLVRGGGDPVFADRKKMSFPFSNKDANDITMNFINNKFGTDEIFWGESCDSENCLSWKNGNKMLYYPVRVNRAYEYNDELVIESDNKANKRTSTFKIVSRKDIEQSKNRKLVQNL